MEQRVIGFGQRAVGRDHRCDRDKDQQHSGTGISAISGITFNNIGTIEVDSGAIHFAQAFGNAGSLDFGIAGTGSYWKLSVAGVADMGGGGTGILAVHFLDGYLPSVGDSFQVLTFGSISSDFANSSWTFDGVTFSPEYGATGLTLDVTSVVAVPEPATYGMMLAGLALIGLIARGRRQVEKQRGAS